MAALVLQTLVNGLRRFCGNPSGSDTSVIDAEIIDDDIELFIGWAVRDILHQIKGKSTKVTYLETVSGQQTYTPIETASEILEVHYNGPFATDSLFSSVAFPNIFPSSPLSGAEYGERSVSLINEIQEREFNRLSRFGKSWDIVEGNIILIPAPEESDVKVYYEYIEDSSDLADLDDTYTRLIYLKASTYVYNQLISARNSSAQVGVTGYQNTLRLSDLMVLKDANEKEFEREIRSISPRAIG